MAALFVFGKYMETRYDGYWGFLRAFAEAGMVGGLADWFAVTALFRHPLGIPIPHTAIIPNNKERLGRTLASFLRTNFLTTKVVARRVQRMDVAGLQHDERGLAGFQRFSPAGDAEAPFVTGLEAGEIELRDGCAEVIAAGSAEVEKLLRHHGTHGV
jgi:hypothetical protein